MGHSNRSLVRGLRLQVVVKCSRFNRYLIINRLDTYVSRLRSRRVTPTQLNVNIAILQTSDYRQ